MNMKVSRTSTADRGPPALPAGVTPIHTVEQLSPNMELLPNGNLLCRNVPFARTGWLVYGGTELQGVKPGQDGLIYAQRDTHDLFNETTMGSFQGAAITDDHPDFDVDPSNWEKLAAGFALNVRRGEGEDADVLFADFIITRKSTIKAVRDGKREVSAGYDADYRQDQPGIARQCNIVGNHIALVDKGRCGPRCAIGDKALNSTPQPKERNMTTRVKVRGNRRTIDAAGLEELRQKANDAQAELDAAEAGETADEGVHVHIHNGATKDASTLDSRVALIESNLGTLVGAITKLTSMVSKSKSKDAAGDDDVDEEDDDPKKKKVMDSDEDPEEDDPKKKKTEDDGEDGDDDDGAQDTKTTDKKRTKDSAALQTAYSTLMSQAEVLHPGFKVPTFDAFAKRAYTVDRMCATRRKVLDLMGAKPEGAIVLQAVNGGRTVDTLTLDCAQTAILFKAAAGLKAVQNNSNATRDSTRVAALEEPKPTNLSIAAINKQAAAFWESKLIKA